jgi:O-antigen/teichoic acid export membrane protein
MSSGRKETTITFFSNVATAFLVLGTQSCLAWLLGREGRGEYAICLAFATLLSVGLGLGIEMALVYYIGSRRLSLSEAVSAGLVLCFISSAAAIGIGVGIISMPLAFVEKVPNSTLHLSLLFVPTSLCLLVATRALIGLGQIVTFNVVSLAHRATVLVLTFALVWFAKLGVCGAIIALISSDILVIVVIFTLLAQRNGFSVAKPSTDALSVLIKYGARFYLGKLGRQLNFQIGTLMLAFLVAKTELGEIGIFAAAMGIMARVWMVPDALNVVLLPRTTKKECGRPELVAKCSRLALACSIVIVVFVLIFAKPLVSVILSPDFLGAIPLMWILTLGILVRSYPKVLASYFNGLGRPGSNSFIILAGLTTNLLLMPVLFTMMGLPGAALAVTVSYLVETAIAVYMFSKISGLNMSRLYRFESSDWAELLSIRRLLR